MRHAIPLSTLLPPTILWAMRYVIVEAENAIEALRSVSRVPHAAFSALTLPRWTPCA